jgi:hypothetical protein
MATNTLDSVLAQYEQSKQGGSSNTSKMSQDERMKKYFAAILKDSEKQGQKRLRILPTKDGSSPFKEVWYHEVQVDGKWNKIYDPGKNDNERSPLTEITNRMELSSGVLSTITRMKVFLTKSSQFGELKETSQTLKKAAISFLK